MNIEMVVIISVVSTLGVLFVIMVSLWLRVLFNFKSKTLLSLKSLDENISHVDKILTERIDNLSEESVSECAKVHDELNRKFENMHGTSFRDVDRRFNKIYQRLINLEDPERAVIEKESDNK